MDTISLCPICRKPIDAVQSANELDTRFYVRCRTCGEYRITDMAMSELTRRDDNARISCYIREREIRNLQPIMITTDSVQVPERSQFPQISINEILNSYPRLLSERLDRALINLSYMSEYTGAPIALYEKDYPVFFPDASMDLRSTMFMISQLIDEGLITGISGFPTNLILTSKGWNRIYDLEKGKNLDYKQAFIAMWFDSSMNDVAENGFKKAIRDAGYDPMRIDDKQHNQKIDDQIIAEIRRSKFVVCDFSGHRGGVYFEAGFAMGLGLPVIWTCKKDDMKDIHFDTRQYNHIVWKDESDLYAQLYNRIRATIV